MEFKKFLFLSFAFAQIQISAGEIENQPKEVKTKVSVASLIIYNWMKYAKCLRSKANHQFHDKYFSKKEEVYNKCFKEAIVKQDSVQYSNTELVREFKTRIAKSLDKQEKDIVLSASTRIAMTGGLPGDWPYLYDEEINFEDDARIGHFECCKDPEETIEKAINGENYFANIEQFEIGIKEEENTKNFVGCVIS